MLLLLIVSLHMFIFVYSSRNNSTMMTEEEKMEAFKAELNALRKEIDMNKKNELDHYNDIISRFDYCDHYLRSKNCRSCRLFVRQDGTIARQLLEHAYEVRDRCCICQDDYTPQTVAYTTECLHGFHKECLYQLYRHQTTPDYNLEIRCPLCNQITSTIGIQITNGLKFNKHTRLDFEQMEHN